MKRMWKIKTGFLLVCGSSVNTAVLISLFLTGMLLMYNVLI